MVISQKAKNIFNRSYIWCVVDNFIVNYDFLVIIILLGAQWIVPSPYYYLISPVGTMHRAPTLPFCLLFGLQSYNTYFKNPFFYKKNHPLSRDFFTINPSYYNFLWHNHSMVISQKAKNIFSKFYIWYVVDNFIVNYDFLVIIML